VGKHYTGQQGHCQPVFYKTARLVGRLGSGPCLMGGIRSGPRILHRLGSGPHLVGRIGQEYGLVPVFNKKYHRVGRSGSGPRLVADVVCTHTHTNQCLFCTQLIAPVFSFTASGRSNTVRCASLKKCKQTSAMTVMNRFQ